MGLNALKKHKCYEPQKKKNCIYNYRAPCTGKSISKKNSTNEEEMCDIAKRIGNDIRKQVIDEANIKPEDIPLEKQSINTIKQETVKQIKKI